MRNPDKAERRQLPSAGEKERAGTPHTVKLRHEEKVVNSRS